MRECSPDGHSDAKHETRPVWQCEKVKLRVSSETLKTIVEWSDVNHWK